jgi:hypothetical protein
MFLPQELIILLNPCRCDFSLNPPPNFPVVLGLPLLYLLIGALVSSEKFEKA